MLFSECPDNVVLLVAGSIEEERDLNALARTSHGFYNALNHVLYHRNVHSAGATALFWAAEHGPTNTVKHWFAAGASVHLRDDYVCSPLHAAAARAQSDMVDFLLSIPQIDVNAVDWINRTPLMEAVSMANEETVARLLYHPGIQPNIPDYALRGYRTDFMTLHHAVAYDSERLIDILLQDPRVDVNPKDSQGRTPLSIAVLQKRESVVKQLLASPGIFVNAGDKSGYVALSHAATLGLEDITVLLLEHDDTEIDAASAAGDTPLHLAARLGRERVVQLLLEKGCDVDRVNGLGLTPAALARAEGHDAIAQLLSTAAEA
jgi:ankyrin repeat protein